MYSITAHISNPDYIVYLFPCLLSVLSFLAFIQCVSSKRTKAFSVSVSALYIKWMTDLLHE